MQTDFIKNVIDAQYGSFIGKTIVEIRTLTDQEMKSLYWYQGSGDIPMVIIFNDGQALIPSSDSEGNGPGFLITADLSK